MTIKSKASLCTFNLPLNEASGDAIDAVGSLNLPEFGGSIGATTGLLYSNSRDFEGGDTEFFRGADNAVLNPTGSFMFRLWFKFESIPASGQFAVLFEKRFTSAGQEYGLYYNGNTGRVITPPARRFRRYIGGGV